MSYTRVSIGAQASALPLRPADRLGHDHRSVTCSGDETAEVSIDIFVFAAACNVVACGEDFEEVTIKLRR